MQTFRRQRKKQPDQSRAGAALIEMALCLPILMLVILGIVEFGRAFMVGNLLTESARDGARQAIAAGSTNTEVEDSVRAHVAELLRLADPEIVAVTITVNGSDTTLLSSAIKRDMCAVEVSVPFDDVSFVPGKFLNGVALRSQCAMRHE